MGEAAGDLLGRPPGGQPLQHQGAQIGVTLEPGARPAPGLAQLLRIVRPIADLRAAVALHLTRDGRRLAIQSCSDLPERMPGGEKLGNPEAIFRG